MAHYPAVIKSYDKKRRKVRIEIKGRTDGDTLLPEADLLYSLGDKSENTEIEILEGDSVWIDFIADDPRYPIVVGFRNPEVGNDIDWRRWHHANIEISADGEMILKGKSLKIEFTTIQTTGTTINNSPITNEATVSMNAGMNNGKGGAVTCTGGFEIQSGDVQVSGGNVQADGISLKEHTHTGDSGGNTSMPK